MKNKMSIFGSKGLVFLCAIALAAAGAAFVGCSNGSTDDTPPPPRWPAAWVSEGEDDDAGVYATWSDGDSLALTFANLNNGKSVMAIGDDTFYVLKSFGGGSFTVKVATDDTLETEEGGLLTVTYSMDTSADPDELTLTSTDIEELDAGVEFTKAPAGGS